MTYDDIVLTEEQQLFYDYIVGDKFLYQYQKNILKYLISNKNNQIDYAPYPRGIERKDVGRVVK